MYESAIVTRDENLVRFLIAETGIEPICVADQTYRFEFGIETQTQLIAGMRLARALNDFFGNSLSDPEKF